MTPRAKFDMSLVPERPDLQFELNLWQKGLRLIAGVDEAGRGALLGPVAAGAVVLPHDLPDLFERLEGVRDSKEMTPENRERWAVVIKQTALSWAVGYATAAEIDQIGIAPATCLAAGRALEALTVTVEHILIDYIKLPDVPTPQTSLVKGDARSLTIAAASVLAKTERDARLVALDADYPGYALASNKGYATMAHRAAIASLGPCALHRHSFAPIAKREKED
ncbi:ribonuclease HII [bacterium]|nr:ribonuclease HII [bacterium]